MLHSDLIADGLMACMLTGKYARSVVSCVLCAYPVWINVHTATSVPDIRLKIFILGVKSSSESVVSPLYNVQWAMTSSSELMIAGAFCILVNLRLE